MMPSDKLAGRFEQEMRQRGSKPAERQRWRKWWDDVADTLAEIATGTTEKK